MSIENEEEVKEQEETATPDPAPKVSRARNRTVMLTPELTGQVRNAIKEEKKEEPGDFFRPGQKTEEPKVQIPNSTQESLQQSNLGLKFGKSVNRSRTTKLTRDELEQAVNKAAKGGTASLSKQETVEASGYNLPTPVVPKTFDPLTSIAPPNHGPGKVPEFAQPRPPARPESRQQVQQPLLSPTHIPAAPVISKGQALTGATKIVGFLISFDQDQNGEVFEIRAGRKLITSRPTDHGEYLLIDHESISPLHAILRTTKEGKLQVLDQLSEHGTGITREGETEEIEVAGGLELVQNGDTLRFGNRHFLVCLVPVK